MTRRVAAYRRLFSLRLAVRVLAAVLLIFVGADHYYEYSVDHYSVLPTIGTLFLLNFLSATIIGLILLAPLKRIVPRFDRLTVRLAALSGFGVAATSLAALLISEQTTLFGFMESNYRPAIIIAIASEAAAATVSALLLFLTRDADRSRTPLPPRSRPSAGRA
jgi:phosphoglycerol transferase MdoB-like AlkP superfamily enzyme